MGLRTFGGPIEHTKRNAIKVTAHMTFDNGIVTAELEIFRPIIPQTAIPSKKEIRTTCGPSQPNQAGEHAERSRFPRQNEKSISISSPKREIFLRFSFLVISGQIFVSIFLKFSEQDKKN
jgi:hypothetical protein